MQAAILADGGPDIGYGHLVRTSAIAGRLRSNGHRVTYMTTTPEAARQVTEDSIPIETLHSRDDPEYCVEFIQSGRPDIVLSDAYEVDTRYQRTVRDIVPLAVLADDNRHTICADLLINGNLYAPDLSYEYVGTPPKELLGVDYVPVRERIRTLAKQSPPWRDSAKRAIVTMGGSDPSGESPTVVQAFDGFDIAVEAIVGPGYSERVERELHSAADDVSAEVHVVKNPEDLPKRMFEADFAISTASSTVYELLALGTPVICLPVASNQELIASKLDEHKAAVIVDTRTGDAPIADAIGTFVRSPEVRRELRVRGRSLVDANGAKRVADELIRLARAN